MCKINLIFSKKELKGVRKAHRDGLQRDAIRQIRKSPQLKKIISKIIRENPPKELRAALRKKLHPKVKRFKLSVF